MDLNLNHSNPLPPLATQTLQDLLGMIVSTARLNLTFHVDPPQPGEPLLVQFDGTDVPHLLARNAELLLALEHLGAKALHLEPEQHHLISFDADSFKSRRERQLQRVARQAVDQVRSTRTPFHFPPMNSRERRLLHLALVDCGLPSRSEGEGATRHLVLHPAP